MCVLVIIVCIMVLQYRQVEEIWRLFAGSQPASVHICQPTRATWESIEMAINGLIESSGAPRWPRELWVCNLCFLSEISQWSAADWYREKSSAGRNRLTKQGRSSPWVLGEKATTATTLCRVCLVLTVGTGTALLSLLFSLLFFLLQRGKACRINITRGSAPEMIGFACFEARCSWEGSSREKLCEKMNPREK